MSIRIELEPVGLLTISLNDCANQITPADILSS